MLIQTIVLKAWSIEKLQEDLNNKLKELYSPILYTIDNIIVTSWDWEYIALIVYRA